ncbi:hypothetical protein ALC60_00677 [Trachymyrmex zeteki]|uniref:Uncharacterized protein n=1 Tax=Mycetomoellerius zeteki TaxID=64791 RepID=A0A151XIP3_9HYME|nr:hypothetical protein ALC60_00677 [Trachymyrmex zeteki]
MSPTRFLSTYDCKYQRLVITKTSGTLSRRVGTGIGRDGRRRTRQLELEMGGQAPTVGDTGGTIVAFGQIINPEVLTFFAS